MEAFFVRHRERMVWLHLAMFVLFLLLLFLPPFLGEPSESATPFDHFTVFSNYLLWGVWFPLVFLSVIFTGRSWCGLLCPMGAASEWANRRGLKRPIPAWLRWEGTPLVSFLVITVLGQTVGVRDHPEAVAEVFGGTLLLAVLIGFLYGRNKRAWCRHACPIGLLLGVFSRIGAVQFAPRRKKPGGDRYVEKGPCPTMIDVARKEESRHCIECFRCVHPGAEKGGLFLRLRRPGEEIEQIRTHNPNPYEVAFLFLGTGMAMGGFLWLVLPQYQALRRWLGEWLVEREWYGMLHPGPSWLMAVHPERREVFTWLDFTTIVSFMLICTLALALVLTLTTALASALSGRLGGDAGFGKRFVELGYQYAPVAMVSLVIGLGGELFEGLRMLGLGEQGSLLLKQGLFLAGLLWSIHLGQRILRRQGVGTGRWLAVAPGVAGSLVVGLGWWPALFGA
ncbi:MAG: 4Fe-4S binding protein [Gammaproteobacteria bacterium]